MPRSLKFLALALLALALIAVPAGAKKSGFKTGKYKATGSVAFKFKVYRGTCYSNGKRKTGYCLSGLSTPKLQMVCPDVKDGPSDYEDFAFIPNQIYIPSSGKISVKFKNTVREGEYDIHVFKLTLGKSGKGSGSLSLESQVKSISVTSTCKSGTQKFKVKKS